MSARLYREEGNKLYKSSMDKIPSSLKHDRLERALYNYNQSLGLSRSDDDISSVTKNLAMTYLQISSLQEDFHQTLYYHTEAAKNFFIAFNRGHICKSQAWLDDLSSTLYTRAIDILEISKQLPPCDRLKWLACYARELPQCIAKGKVSSVVMKMLFKQSVIALEYNEFEEAAGLLDECSYWIEETRRFGDSNLRYKSEECRNSVYTHMCLCESIRARKNAKALLARSLNDSEELDMDFVYHALDTYRQSILLVRGRDLECEAICLSKIGYIHYKVLKDDKRAGDCFTKCLEIATAMKPRDFTNRKWHKKAFDGLNKIQAKRAREDDAAHEAAKSEFYSTHTTILEAIKNAFNKSVYDLLKHIYANHSPEINDYVLPDLTSDNIKKVVLKAIQHYHPDKQSPRGKGKNWEYLCEEITKYLTSKYEAMKGTK